MDAKKHRGKWERFLRSSRVRKALRKAYSGRTGGGHGNKKGRSCRGSKHRRYGG